MKLSQYSKRYPYEDGSGQWLLFSTKKASKILVTEETLQSIEKGSLSPSDEALLSRLGMIVEDREEEKRSVLSLLDRMNANNSELNITVVLNLDCNFACIYCYEGDMKGKLYMSDETADRLIHFIKTHFPEHKKSLRLDFYGGEPLLSLGRITSISERLKSFTEAKGASYGFTLVTNGSLFKRQVAKDLVPLGLTNVQISLDGPAENHNRYRPFKSGAASFDTLIRNIKETWDLVKIGIGGNFARDTYQKFPLLLEELVNEGITPNKIASVKFAPIINRPKGDLSPVDYKDGCMSSNEPWLLHAEALIRETILRRGYYTPKAGPVFCMVEDRDAYVVNFDGVLYKCPGFIGKHGFEVGDLQTGVREYSASYRLGMWKNGDCVDCEYLPLCFGGCRYVAFVQDGNIDHLDCRKAYFDASLERLIKQDIKYRRSPASP